MNKLNGMTINHPIKLVARLTTGKRIALNPEIYAELDESNIRYITPLFWSNAFESYVSIPDVELDDIYEEWLLQYFS